MTTLIELNEVINDYIKSCDGDYKTFAETYDLVDSAECLRDLRSIRFALTRIILGVYSDECTRLAKTASNDYLYIISSASMGAVKIGRTKHTAQIRANQIKVGCPDAVVEYQFSGLDWAESKVHKKLKKFHIGGEWFAVTPEFAKSVIQAILNH